MERIVAAGGFNCSTNFSSTSSIDYVDGNTVLNHCKIISARKSCLMIIEGGGVRYRDRKTISIQ